MNSYLGELINNIQLQVFFYFRGEITAPENILIAAIDDDSFLNENISSLKAWPRDFMAEAIENIAKAGGKFLILDMMIDPNTYMEGADQRYANSLSLLPSSIAMFEYKSRVKDLNGRLKIKNNIRKPRDEFINSAKFLTPMMVQVDTDGLVRRFYHSNRYQKEGKKPIPMAELAQAIQNKKIKNIPRFDEYINYYGYSGTLKTVSINKFLTKNLKQNLIKEIKDKIILIGTFRQTQVESTSEDQFNTNFGNIFGAEIHATVLANIMNQNWIKKLQPGFDLFIIFTITILCSFLSISAGPLIGSIISIFSAILLVLTSYQLFLNHYFLPCFTYSLIIVPILIIGILSFHYFTTLKAFKQVEEALGVSLRPQK